MEKNFAVIYVHLDYEYVDYVECLKIFPTQEEAQNHIAELEKERDTKWKQYLSYIEQYVEGIETPDTDYEGWHRFIRKYFGENCMYVFPKDFQRSLKQYLRDYNPKLKDYNPPQRPSLGHNQLFAVEIK